MRRARVMKKKTVSLSDKIISTKEIIEVKIRKRTINNI